VLRLRRFAPPPRGRGVSCQQPTPGHARAAGSCYTLSVDAVAFGLALNDMRPTSP
jgi:hypothetical protein